MLKASEFVPVGFELGIRADGLTQSAGRLVARLLSKYGELVSDEVELGMPGVRPRRGGPVQLLFPDYGALNVDVEWVAFDCWSPPESGPESGWISGQLPWVVGLLRDVLEIQRKAILGVNFETTWLLWGEQSTDRLIRHLGLSEAMNGFFAHSEIFEIRGSMTAPLPGLFDIESDFMTGRLIEYGPPENVGVKIEYRSPDARTDGVTYDWPVIDRFLIAATDAILVQLDLNFPSRETA